MEVLMSTYYKTKTTSSFSVLTEEKEEVVVNETTEFVKSELLDGSSTGWIPTVKKLTTHTGNHVNVRDGKLYELVGFKERLLTKNS